MLIIRSSWCLQYLKARLVRYGVTDVSECSSRKQRTASLANRVQGGLSTGDAPWATHVLRIIEQSMSKRLWSRSFARSSLIRFTQQRTGRSGSRTFQRTIQATSGGGGENKRVTVIGRWCRSVVAAPANAEHLHHIVSLKGSWRTLTRTLSNLMWFKKISPLNRTLQYFHPIA